MPCQCSALRAVAWNPPGTLFQIFVLKFEILVQVAPAFILGLYWKRLSSTAVFWGMLVGAIIAGGMTLIGYETVFGIHGGIYGLAINFMICVVGSLMTPMTQDHKTEVENMTKINPQQKDSIPTGTD